MLKEFREFALRGNVVDMAVGIIIGGAFGTIVSSMVDDVLMPPLGLLLGNVDFQDLFLVLREGVQAPGPYPTVAAAQEAGAVTINYGLFINNLISFLLIAIAVFFLVRTMNQLRRDEEEEPAEPTAKDCPYCKKSIAIEAVRCPHCTSELVQG
ncbi:MAG: large-conductance mechanosensitive channel protein MscL [Anaerolineales bacterium]